jgi:hypothetical protein
VRVYLDGKYAGTVDTRHAAANQQLVWAKTVRSGRHTVSLVVAGTRGRPWAVVDGFVSRP